MIFGPIVQVGWARASSTVDRGQLARAAAPERAPRGGEQAAGPRRPRVARPRRHWWTAQCSESTGMISAPGVRRARCTTGAPAMIDSLLARASRRPASSAARVTGSPANPTTPLTTTSATVAMAARPSGPATTSMPGGHQRGQLGGQGRVADGHHRGRSVGPGRPAGRPTVGARAPPPRTGPARPRRPRWPGSRSSRWTRPG